jgi:hypothetical protein
MPIKMWQISEFMTTNKTFKLPFVWGQNTDKIHSLSTLKTYLTVRFYDFKNVHTIWSDNKKIQKNILETTVTFYFLHWSVFGEYQFYIWTNQGENNGKMG